jgi:hypothetical protein
MMRSIGDLVRNVTNRCADMRLAKQKAEAQTALAIRYLDENRDYFSSAGQPHLLDQLRLLECAGLNLMAECYPAEPDPPEKWLITSTPQSVFEEIIQQRMVK